ncbi:MAG: S46 family peptidase [Melioribacteraceae bacterium]|nr:S46 family peptidase [Melioribacteraceae bacterium]
MKKNFLFFTMLFSVLFIISACSTSEKVTSGSNKINYDTVKAGKFDTGKMWTFEDAPINYFKETYGFEANDEWLKKARLSSLKFASWCSGSFVSGDGLIMTNHHCIDFVSTGIEKEGEDIKTNGFYAETLEDERQVPGVFVDQLVLTKDVTDELYDEMAKGKTDEEKILLRDKKIEEIEKKYSEETGLVIKITSLYNGGKYSLYGYKRYNEVRAVLFLESEVGLYGGDPDNFTYPRYNADFAFLRVYDDNGEPLKVDNFFGWSLSGPEEDEPIFVIGNPGSTNRLNTVSQLEYARDVSYKNLSFLYNNLTQTLDRLMREDESKKEEFEDIYMMISNSAKVFKYVDEGLNDEMFMARKKAFERDFKNLVKSDAKLDAEYGHLWKAIEDINNEKLQFANEYSVFNLNPQVTPDYFMIASDAVNLAKQLQLPEDQRDESFKSENLEETISLIFPEDFDPYVEKNLLAIVADYFRINLGDDNSLVMNLFSDKKGMAAAEFAVEKSKISTPEKLKELASKGGDAILNSGDPFINYQLEKEKVFSGYSKKMKELNSALEALQVQLGKALYEVYGTTIAPDATFTLRINDGVVKGYEYNGTVAPWFTTFYGLYDRYYSHQKEYPWALPERWTKYDHSFDLSKMYNFISTNDIVGGSSGSPVINKNLEVVGLAFDGNIESITGNFLYSTEKNRMVSVASPGIYEIVSDLLKMKRLAEEIRTGKLYKVQTEEKAQIAE